MSCIGRYCQCGCGTELPQNYSFFVIRGHRRNIVNTCQCGCGQITYGGKKYIHRHQHNSGFGTFYGRKHSEESKRKMSEARIGRFGAEKHPMYGKKHSEESKQKMSQSLIGRKTSDETRKKLSAAHSGINHHFYGKNLSDEHVQKLSISHMGKLGDQSSNWKGGTKLLSNRLRALFYYRDWKLHVYSKDRFCCTVCGIVPKYLHAHHLVPLNQVIKKNRIKTLDDAIACKEIWDVENGVSLCTKCHAIEHNGIIKGENFFVPRPHYKRKDF